MFTYTVPGSYIRIFKYTEGIPGSLYIDIETYLHRVYLYQLAVLDACVFSCVDFYCCAACGDDRAIGRRSET